MGPGLESAHAPRQFVPLAALYGQLGIGCAKQHHVCVCVSRAQSLLFVLIFICTISSLCGLAGGTSVRMLQIRRDLSLVGGIFGNRVESH